MSRSYSLHLTIQFLLQGTYHTSVPTRSVTRLVHFGKFLTTNFKTKVSQIFDDFWALLKTEFLSKNRCGTLARWQLFEIIELHFISASGHTANVHQIHQSHSPLRIRDALTPTLSVLTQSLYTNIRLLHANQCVMKLD